MSLYTMTDARQRSVLALEYYERCTRLQVAYSVEARLCQAAAEGTGGRYFIRAFECGECDARLYVGRENLIGNATERSFQLLDSQQEQESLVPMDIKSISPVYQVSYSFSRYISINMFARYSTVSRAVSVLTCLPGILQFLALYQH